MQSMRRLPQSRSQLIRNDAQVQLRVERVFENIAVEFGAHARAVLCKQQFCGHYFVSR